MDVRLTDGSGIEATREIRADRPETQVLMLTSFADDEALFASIMAGASGYVLKQIHVGELLRAIRAVGAGESLLDPAVTKSVLDRLRKGKHLMQDEKLARLSPQEERILTAGRRRQDQQRDRRRAAPGGEDREELRLEHPVQARGRPPRRGRRLPGAAYHHSRAASSSGVGWWAMARLRPFVEREAMWAAGLASLSAISFWATLPAAVFLSIRIIRRGDRGHGDGSEPAYAALALALALLGFWFALPLMYAIVRTAWYAHDAWRILAFAGGLVSLSVVVVALSTYFLRCHPERWIARRLAMAGLLVAVLTGGLQAVLALSKQDGLPAICGRVTASNADCVGSVPWAAVLPAAVMGIAVFAVSVATTGTRRWVRAAARANRRPPRPDLP